MITHAPAPGHACKHHTLLACVPTTMCSSAKWHMLACTMMCMHARMRTHHDVLQQALHRQALMRGLEHHPAAPTMLYLHAHPSRCPCMRTHHDMLQQALHGQALMRGQAQQHHTTARNVADSLGKCQAAPCACMCTHVSMCVLCALGERLATPCIFMSACVCVV